MLRTVVVTILFLASSFMPALGGGGRIALVVGVSKYEHAPSLPNTLNDAKDMSAALKRLGFDVETILDPSRSDFEAAVRRYGDRSVGAEASVFHYSGHALEANGRNWLLPATVNVTSERDLRFEAVDLNTILEQADGGARVSIVFLDACRDNPFAGRIAASGRGLARGLARIEVAASGVLVAYSTAPGQVALDTVGAKKNSPFTAALLSHLQTAGLEVKSLLSRVTRDVVEETKGKQRPWQNSSLEGDFYFVPPPTAAATPAAQPNVNIEGVFWDSIKASSDPAEFKLYLTKFPNGVFAELAEIRIAALQQATVKEPLSNPRQQTSSPLAQPPQQSPSLPAPQEMAKANEDKALPATHSGARSALAYNTSGNAYRGKNDYDRAIADYNEAIRLDPTYAAAYNNRGIAYRDKKDYDRAIADFNEAVRLDPNFTLAYNERGVAYKFKRDSDRAVADYSEAIRVNPKFAPAYNNRGIIYRDRKDFDHAIADYNEAIRLDPNYALAYFNRAGLYQGTKDYGRAIMDYGEAIRIKPIIPISATQAGEMHVNAYHGRGTAYRDQGDWDRAIADFNEALRIDPDYAVAYNQRGIAYFFKGDDNRAIADYNEAIRLNSKDASPYNSRGRAYAKRKDYERAIEDYNEAIRLNPRSALYLMNRGDAFLGNKNYDRAVADYTDAIRITPLPPVIGARGETHGNGYFKRGYAYDQKKDYDHAIADYNEAIRLDPKFAVAYNYRGFMHFQKTEYDRAIADYNEAIRLEPNYAIALNNRANAYRARQQLKP